MERSSLSPASHGQAQLFEELGAHLGAIAYRGWADEDRTFFEVVGSAERLTGHAAHVLAGGGLPFAALIHPDDRAAAQSELQLAVAGRRSFQLCYRIAPETSAVRWVWEFGTVGPTERDGNTQIRGFILDVTGAPHTRVHAMVEGVAAGVAHDLRNLLSVITSGAELLRRTLAEDSPAQTRLAQIGEVAESSGRLASQPNQPGQL